MNRRPPITAKVREGFRQILAVTSSDTEEMKLARQWMAGILEFADSDVSEQRRAATQARVRKHRAAKAGEARYSDVSAEQAMLYGQARRG